MECRWFSCLTYSLLSVTRLCLRVQLLTRFDTTARCVLSGVDECFIGSRMRSSSPDLASEHICGLASTPSGLRQLDWLRDIAIDLLYTKINVVPHELDIVLVWIRLIRGHYWQEFKGLIPF